MDRDIYLILVGAGISLISTLMTLILQFLFSQILEKRKEEKAEEKRKKEQMHNDLSNLQIPSKELIKIITNSPEKMFSANILDELERTALASENNVEFVEEKPSNKASKKAEYSAGITPLSNVSRMQFAQASKAARDLLKTIDINNKYEVKHFLSVDPKTMKVEIVKKIDLPKLQIDLPELQKKGAGKLRRPSSRRRTRENQKKSRIPGTIRDSAKHE